MNLVKYCFLFVLFVISRPFVVIGFLYALLKNSFKRGITSYHLFLHWCEKD